MLTVILRRSNIINGFIEKKEALNFSLLNVIKTADNNNQLHLSGPELGVPGEWGPCFFLLGLQHHLQSI